jgi:hypothetical protein
MYEGSVSKTIDQSVTHVVVYTAPQSPVPYKTLLQRLVPNFMLLVWFLGTVNYPIHLNFFVQFVKS